MIIIQKLKQPRKQSGYKLPPGETTEVRGLVIVNKNKFDIYIDKWTRKDYKKKTKKTVKKTAKKVL